MKRKIIKISVFLFFLIMICCKNTFLTYANELKTPLIANGKCGDNLVWQLDSDGVLTISGTGNMYNYDLEMGSPWKDFEKEITSVVVERGVTSIGDEAFGECSSLTSIKIPSSVTNIGNSTFYKCSSLTSIEIPSTVTRIGDFIFFGCSSLKNIEIPSSITYIGLDAFKWCKNLTNIEIPSSVTGIGNGAFSGCSSLTSIKIPSSVTYIGLSGTFNLCSSLTSIELPSIVTNIGSHAFSGCSSLTSIKLPATVTNIEYSAFSHCESLIDVYYGGSEEQWHLITIGSDNEHVKMANIHYNYLKETDSDIDNDSNSDIGYASVVQDCIWNCGYASLPDGYKEDCRGLLYDIENDGQEELILQYLSDKGDYESGTYDVWTVEVWTIKDNSLIQLLEADIFSTIGPPGILIVNYDKNFYFTLTMFRAINDNNNAGGYTTECQLYQITNNSYKRMYDVSKIDYMFDFEDEKYYLNGEWVNVSDFEKIYRCVEDGTKIPIEEKGYLLDELLNKLSSEADIINEHPYIQSVKNAITMNSNVNYSGDGYGALYDVDGNGVEELFLTHSAKLELENNRYAIVKVCSVYTLSNGTSVPLIENEVLFYDAGSPWGFVGVIDKGGQIYLAVNSSNGGVEYPIEFSSGRWDMYLVDGISIKQSVALEYVRIENFDDASIVYDESSVTINGEEYPYTVYEKWKQEIEQVFAVYPYDIPNEPQYEETKTLRELLEYLKEQPIEGPNDDFDIDDSQNVIHTEWINQHLEYASSDEYESEIVRGFNNRMLAVFRDALDDEEIRSFETRKAISSLLNLDIELSESDMYELILAEILYGDRGQFISEETYNQALSISYSNTMKALVSIANSGDSATKIPKDVRQNIDELYQLSQTMEFGSEDYGKTCSKFVSLLIDNVSDLKGKLKTELLGDAAFTGLGIVIDGAFEQYEALEDILSYINNYVAYQSMSEQTQEVFIRLATNVLYYYDGLYGVDAFIDELGLESSLINMADFQMALISVAKAMKEYEQEGAATIAEYAVEREREAGRTFGEKALKSVIVFAVEKGASCVPFVNTIVLAKNIVSTGLSISVILDQIFTNVEDREYALDMLTKAYCISVMLDITVDDCADCMSADDFYSTTVFDESVSIYKKNLLFASAYALKYADMVLENAINDLEKYDDDWNYLFTNREKLVAAVDWYRNSYKLLEEQQIKIQKISCHDSNLHYDPLTDDIIYDFKDSKIYIVACPVDVVVTTDTGEQIAYLSGVENKIVSGYEFYFHAIRLGENSDEYIKVAIVPDKYRIELKGTNKGIMNAFVADFSIDSVDNAETYFNIPITEDSEGYFETEKKDGYTNALMMNQIVYSNMEQIEDLPNEIETDAVPNESSDNSIYFWIISGIVVCFSLLTFVKKKKSYNK